MSAAVAGMAGRVSAPHDPAMNDSLRTAVSRRLGFVLAALGRSRRSAAPRTVAIRVSSIDPRYRRAFTRRSMRVQGWAPLDRF